MKYVESLVVRAEPSTIQIAQASQVTVYAQDSVSSAPVSGSVMINGQKVGNTNTPFSHTFAASDTTATVTATGYNSAVVSFSLYKAKLLVHVQPYPISFKANTATVNLTVYSEDSQSHTPIAGRVIIDGKDVSSTNTPFTYTFTRKVLRRRSPDGGFEVDTIYPSGNVSAAGYDSEGIDFGFPE